MKISRLKKGSLVKNIRDGAIGVVLFEEGKSFKQGEDAAQFYKVLSDGKVVSWFTSNMKPVELSDEQDARAITERMA